MHRGFIVLWRKIEDNPIFKDSIALHLFIYLILEANHAPSKFIFNGQEETLSRGQIITGRFSIAEKTGISPSTAYKKLKLLENLGFCSIKSNTKFSIVSLSNYSLYQDLEIGKELYLEQQRSSNVAAEEQQRSSNVAAEEQQRSSNVAAEEQQRSSNVAQTTIQPLEPLRTTKNNNKPAFDFECLWIKYPKKQGKYDALRHFKAQVTSQADYDAINKAVDNFLGSKVCRGDPQFIPHGSTWFNNRWRDWIDYTEPVYQEKEGDENVRANSRAAFLREECQR